MSLRHPPVVHPVYGLDQTWEGPRWLESVDGRLVDGQLGGPTYGVWLGHSRAPVPKVGRLWTLVGTLPREGLGSSSWADDGAFGRYLAEAAVIRLAHCLPNLFDDLDAQVDRWRSWDTMTLSVDGQAREFHVLRHGDAWAAFSADLASVGLVVQAMTASVTSLVLEVVDTRAYHFDVAQPVEYPGTTRASRRAAFRGAGLSALRGAADRVVKGRRSKGPA